MKTATNAPRYRFVGIEDSDGQPCECCGTRCPKRRVVLRKADSGEFVRFGSMCAALATLGRKSAKNNATTLRNACIAAEVSAWRRAGSPDYAPLYRCLWQRFGVSCRVLPTGEVDVAGVGLV